MTEGGLHFLDGRCVHVLEWAALHRNQLQVNWQRAREGKPLDRIAPLE